MTDTVKPKRRYESPRRQEQAAATRRAILEAAETLFARDGYAATTMAAIAAEAGVAAKTVYLAFDSKSGLLRALWHLRLRGDQAEVPMGRREWFTALLAEPDPHAQVQRLAAQSRAVKERAGRLFAVIRSAAVLEPEIAELWQRIEREFRALLHPIAQSLAEKEALRPGLDVERATDVLWMLNHPDVWHLLVDGRGWDAQEWEQWFLEAVHSQVLAASR